MQSLAFIEVSAATAYAIAERHGLGSATCTRLPQIGVINAIYLLGDTFVLRVPRNQPGTIAQAHTEAIAAPVAHAAGLRTPRVIVYDATCDLLPVPYLIEERVHGRTLGLCAWEPAPTQRIWHALGHDLALLHTGVPADGPAGQLPRAEPLPDPRALAEERASDGWLSDMEVRWITRWLDRLAPAARAPVPARMLHLDVQTTNIMVDEQVRSYHALLDWGCAGWGDPAHDFFGMPLRAVPFILEGHRAVAPLDGDEGAEARILWRHLQMALAIMPRGAAPGMSWGERPLAWLLEVFRFFADAPSTRWRELRP